METLQQFQLAIVGVALSRRAVVTGRLQTIDALLHHRQVGQRELDVESLEVAPGVDRTFRMRHRRVIESPDHVQQRVGFPQSSQLVGRQLLGSDAAFGRSRRRRQIEVGDVGLDDLLRLEDLGQRNQSVVGNLDRADVQFHATITAGLGVAAGESVEDRGLPRAGKPDDGDLH